MSLLPVVILGREVDLVPPAVLCGLVVARGIAEQLLTRHREKGRRTGRVTTALLFLSYVGGLALALRGLGLGGATVRVTGGAFALWGAAIAFRIWALVHLREQFSFWIEIREQHRLVDTGPYAIIRHPLHLAFALEVSAFALAAWSAWAAVPAALVWIVVLVRNRTEEAALREHFGKSWDEYAARVPSMNPVRGLVNRARRESVP